MSKAITSSSEIICSAIILFLISIVFGLIGRVCVENTSEELGQKPLAQSYVGKSLQEVLNDFGRPNQRYLLRDANGEIDLSREFWHYDSIDTDFVVHFDSVENDTGTVTSVSIKK